MARRKVDWFSDVGVGAACLLLAALSLSLPLSLSLSLRWRPFIQSRYMEGGAAREDPARGGGGGKGLLANGSSFMTDKTIPAVELVETGKSREERRGSRYTHAVSKSALPG